jgi:flavin-dependent dehydrogenase
MRIAIIGNGINANLAALYFKKRLPESTEVTLIGPENRDGLPLVGESIIEITTNFLEHQLGMGEYLMKNHIPKYSLTYYFKLNPDDPTDRTYSVHCNEQGPEDREPLAGWKGPMAQPASWLLNRDVFDRDLKSRVAQHEGINRIDGHVTNVELNGQSGHRLEIKKSDNSTSNFEADWVIDATGRKQLLARKLNLIIKPEGQRDCFWFRVKDFDRSLLKNLNALGPMPPAEGEDYHYDRYYSTHHFLGKGNWIWMIPMKGEDGSDMMSIGLVSHPDHYEHNVRSTDDFIEQVSKVHPVVTDFVKSGNIVDSNLLKRYHYVVEKVYSPDRWGIIGDAAFAPDPMFSNGLAFGTIQLEQLGQLISEDCEGKNSSDNVKLYSDAFMAPVLSSQTAISNWYQSMDDPYLSSLRLNWIEVVYFYMFLPLVINRCHYDPKRLKLWKVMQLRDKTNNFEIPKELIEARALFDKPTPEHFIYKGKEKTNPKALKVFENIDGIYTQIENGSKLLEKYTSDVVNQINKLAKN